VLALSAGPQLVRQMSNLIETLPSAFHNVEGYAEKYLGDGWATTARATDLHPTATTIVAGARGAVLGSFQIIAGLVVIGFTGLYGALSPRAYARVALVVVPPQHRVRARQVLTETVRRLGRWIVGRAVAMAFVGVATSAGLWALHVPLAFALGVLAGVLAFIEFFGAIASAIPPILLALSVSPSKAAWVVVLFLGVHLVEGYLLTPFIARTAVHFPPGYTLALQALFGALFGILGLTFATPTGIVAVTIIEILYVRDVLGERTLPSLPKAKPT
jgi:predicted PurR-regulated permease PerM